LADQGQHGSTWNLPDPRYDLLVVGGGHAGIEAALAGARMGLKTLLVTMSTQTIAQLSCNPAVGGIGKGQLVREIDALGGEMGRLADRACIQFRMLNQSKGPAVWSPRAQVDKSRYAQNALEALEHEGRLDLRQGQVTDVETRDGAVTAAILDSGTRIHAGAVVICAGTFLEGRIHVGEAQTASGRAGEPPAVGLSQALRRLGIEIRRYKTGTPPRVDRDSIDFSQLEIQPGDARPRPFRHYESLLSLPQLPCHATWTNARTHEILRGNLHRSPLYAGRIEGIGPRYCPSVEDKVVRFADKERHPVFLEPETVHGREMYVNGFSTSMPEDVQLTALRTLPGFQAARMIRPGYAIEYDYFPAWQITSSLAVRTWRNLYFAGQINGTSGYEEAAAQGLIAAIQAARLLDGKEPLTLGRDHAYLGVLLDDLVTKPLPEPYRMFTSRAEFRLLLRQDNADLRLMPLGHELGLLEDWRWQVFTLRQELRARIQDWLRRTTLSPTTVLPLMARNDDNELPQQDTHAPETIAPRRAAEWLKRVDLRLPTLLSVAAPHLHAQADEDLLLEVELGIKYAGYIERQARAVEAFRRNEDLALPADLDYAQLRTASTEARERLAQVRPANLGQASRVAGVRPTDVQALWIHLQKRLLRDTQDATTGEPGR
jgi:tRNA uridine 5-carboxymethylaminomethyl modification enzyme